MARRGLPTLAAAFALAAAGCTTPAPAPTLSPPQATLNPSGPAATGAPSSLPPPKDAPTPIADVDGDGQPDLVVVDRGQLRDDPEDPETSREGSVQVLLSGSGELQQWTMSDLGLEWSDSSWFGAGRLIADLNLDGYADVILSDPTPEPEGGDRGAVYALWGGPDGLSPGRFATLAVGEEGSITGWSLALVDRPTRTLAVGTQHATGGGVALYPVGEDGSLAEPTLIDLDSPGIPGTPSKKNEFGSALAASGDLLAIGDPGATVDKAAGAGAVTLLRLTDDGYTASQLTEATEGVQGGPEPGDQFGWAVSLHRGLLAVGVPGEALGDIDQAGRIYLFTVSESSVKPLPYLTQDSPGVAGNAEPGDRFGESVTVFRPCDGTLGVLVGVAGELSGDSPSGAGAVQTVRVSGAACKSLTIASETAGGLTAAPFGTDGSLTVLRQEPGSDAAETVVAMLADDQGAAVLRPPFSKPEVRSGLRGGLAQPRG